MKLLPLVRTLSTATLPATTYSMGPVDGQGLEQQILDRGSDSGDVVRVVEPPVAQTPKVQDASISTAVLGENDTVILDEVAAVIQSPDYNEVLVISQAASQKLDELVNLAGRHGVEIFGQGITKQMGDVTVVVDVVLPEEKNILKLKQGIFWVEATLAEFNNLMMDTISDPRVKRTVSMDQGELVVRITQGDQTMEMPYKRCIEHDSLVEILAPDSLAQHFDEGVDVSEQMVLSALESGHDFSMRTDWTMIVRGGSVMITNRFYGRAFHLANIMGLDTSFNAHHHPVLALEKIAFRDKSREQRMSFVNEKLLPSDGDMDAYESWETSWASIHTYDSIHPDFILDAFFRPQDYSGVDPLKYSPDQFGRLLKVAMWEALLNASGLHTVGELPSSARHPANLN